jgi:hypothetical protein
MREVNRENILNYESDSEEPSGIESSYDVVKANTVSQSFGKEEAALSNNPWGSSKKHFYK